MDTYRTEISWNFHFDNPLEDLERDSRCIQHRTIVHADDSMSDLLDDPNSQLKKVTKC